MKDINNFDAIRPYLDQEVPEVVNRLNQDNQFIETIGQYFHPHLFRWFPNRVKNKIRKTLNERLSTIHNIDTFQTSIIRPALKQLINKTVTKLSFSGIENLAKDTSYLFFSNHRDIVLDPTLTNYVLHINNFPTVHVAIGDNLLQIPFVNDLMRLNKSFIVKRSVSALREKVYELKRLSAYINHLLNNHCSVWIANREGRAKDGLDACDPAIIKMLYLSQKENKNFTEAMQDLKIVPVTISYEYDPCDLLKARELLITSKQGYYTKEKSEDMLSITNSIVGNKGQVHVHFDKPITHESDLANINSLAEHIDRAIMTNYHLHPSNYTAYRELFNQGLSHKNLSGKTFSNNLPTEQHKINPKDFANKNFLLRLAKVPEELRRQVLTIYANPVIQKYNLPDLKPA